MPLDAYTIRKIAPRLLTAVIAVNLSIYLCIAAIDITNVIGGGFGDLIRAPIRNTDAFESLKLPENAVNETIGTGTVVGIVGVGGGAAAGVGFLQAVTGAAFTLGGQAIAATLMFLLVAMASAVLIAIAIMATLVIRYGAILILTLVSPIAFAMWVLPGTERYFRTWWDIFLKALIMYPIIAMIFAVSDVLGALLLRTLDDQNQGLGIVVIFVIILAVYAPLFMIPFAFKLAGGILGAVYDFANRRGLQPMGERINKWKQDPESWYAQAANKRREQRNRTGLTMKQVSSGSVAGLGALRRREGLSGFAAAYGGRSRRIGAQRAMAFKKQAQERELIQLLEGDDDISKAAYYGGTREEVMNNLMAQSHERFGGVDKDGKDWETTDRVRNREEAADLVMGLQSQFGDDVRKLVASEEYSKATTAYKGERGAAEAFDLARGASESQLLRTRSFITQKQNQAQVNRELGLASTSKMLGMQLEHGAGIENAGGDQALIDTQAKDLENRVIDSAIEKASPSQLATMDNNGLKRVATRINERLRLATEEGIGFNENGERVQLNTPEELDSAIQMEVAHLANFRDALNYASVENRSKIAPRVFAQAVQGEVLDLPKRRPDGSIETKTVPQQVKEDILDVHGKVLGQRVVTREVEQPVYEPQQVNLNQLVEEMETNSRQYSVFGQARRTWGGDVEEQRRRAGKPPGEE